MQGSGSNAAERQLHCCAYPSVSGFAWLRDTCDTDQQRRGAQSVPRWLLCRLRPCRCVHEQHRYLVMSEAATRYAEGLWSRRYSDSSTSARTVDCCRRVFLYKVLTALPDRATQPLQGGAAWKRVGLAPKRPQVQILSPQPDSPTCNESLTTVARPVIDENSHDDSNVHQQNSKAHVAWRLVRRGRPVS